MPQAPGMIGQTKRPSYNYWETRPSEPMKVALVERYSVACKYVSGKVLDVACGWGYGTKLLRDHHDHRNESEVFVGVDKDKEAIIYAQQQTHEDKHLHFRCRDIEAEWPFDVSSFDWIVTLETVEHLQDPDAFLQQAQQTVTKGIVISIPARKNKNSFHLHDITVDTLKAWFEGWQELELTLLKATNDRPLSWLAVYRKPRI